jgi:cytochrome b561
VKARASGRYDRIAMALHWVIAGLMIYMIFFGEGLIRGERGAAITSLVGPSLHASLGIAILVLSVARLAWRLANPPPAHPPGITSWEQTLSKVTHALLYGLMIGMPLTGLLGFDAQLTRHPEMAGVTIFGLMTVPLIATSLPFMLLHSLGSKLGMALISLHVLAALKHQFVNRDGLMGRMLPL